MSKKYHTVVRREYNKDNVIRVDYLRIEDTYYEDASFYEKYYSDNWSYPDTISAVVINQFVTDEGGTDE